MKVFELFDDEGTGKIGFKQLKRVVTELGESLSDDEMREMIEEADRDHDGFVTAGKCTPRKCICSFIERSFPQRISCES